MAVNINDVVVQTANGNSKSLQEFNGLVLLIVNVASKCGFTKQYAGLQALQNAYGSRGFHVLGFPCNDFGAQEPGSLEEIQKFCSTTFGVNFQLFAKVHAKGDKTEPFTTLTKTNPEGDVAWNFEKFLIGKDGTVIKRFTSNVEPESKELTSAIEQALSE